MATRSQVQMEWGTSAECAAFAGAAREWVWDTTNQRIVVYLGTGAGNFVPMASETYVQNQISAIGAVNVAAQILARTRLR
jgi:hypothetical protein